MRRLLALVEQHLGVAWSDVADWLRQQGIDAVNVSGGTLAWIDAGLDVSSGPAT